MTDQNLKLIPEATLHQATANKWWFELRDFEPVPPGVIPSSWLFVESPYYDSALAALAGLARWTADHGYPEYNLVASEDYDPDGPDEDERGL